MSKSESSSCKHEHHHSHGHHHHHGATGRMGLAFVLNLIFAILELVGGLLTNSLAILSDAFHDFGDCAAIGIAWFLERKSLKASTSVYSYGYRRFSVMSALLTGVILFVGSTLILIKAIPRLFNPEQPHIEGMIALAFLGLAVNGFAAFRMSKGGSISERMILVHLLEDVLGWFVILVGAVVMWIQPMPILDPIMAIGVAVWVLWNAYKNLKETMMVFLQATPTNIDLQAVENSLRKFDWVHDLHHTHVWSMDGEHHILTMHLIVKAEAHPNHVHELKNQIKKHLLAEFRIQEATIEIEWPDQHCADPQH
jgi:cobalt-zinc-cadmium efflux system protein